MRTLRNLLLALSISALVALAVTIVIGDYYVTQARFVQRVEVGHPAVRQVGPPQKLIIPDPQAFLPGTDPHGARFVNESYLRRHGITPRSLRDIGDAVSSILIGAVFVAGISLFGWFILILRTPGGGTILP